MRRVDRVIEGARGRRRALRGPLMRQQAFRLSWRHWAGAEISLQQPAADLAQPYTLRLRLSSFCDRVHAQAARQVHDRSHDLLALRRIESAREIAVDLDRCDRESVEVAERGIPRPEVIQMETYAHRGEVTQRGKGRVSSVD